MLATEPSDERIVNAKILHGSCFALTDDQHYALKEALAAEFSLAPHQDLFVVGSAKLGYSIAPNKRYRQFGEFSDIDVAVVSHDLYQRVWHEAQAYSESGADWPRKERFEKYISWGWIRPDMLPNARTFEFSRCWREFFMTLQRSRKFGPYKIAGALYHDMHFLTQYQRRAVSLCRDHMELSRANIGN